MEGKKERKEQGRGKERKDAKTFQSSPKAGVHQEHVCVCVRYLKSRNHDLLKELKELNGIIEQRRRAVSDDLGSQVP